MLTSPSQFLRFGGSGVCSGRPDVPQACLTPLRIAMLVRCSTASCASPTAIDLVLRVSPVRKNGPAAGARRIRRAALNAPICDAVVSRSPR